MSPPVYTHVLICPNSWRPCLMLVTDCWLLLKSFFPLVTGFYAGGVIWKIGKDVIVSRKTASMVFSQCHFLLREEYSMRTWSIVSVLQARKMYQQATEILPFAATLWKDVKFFNIFCCLVLVFFFSKFWLIFTRDILIVLFQFHSFWCSNSLRRVMAQPSRK